MVSTNFIAALRPNFPYARHTMVDLSAQFQATFQGLLASHRPRGNCFKKLVMTVDGIRHGGLSDSNIGLVSHSFQTLLKNAKRTRGAEGCRQLARQKRSRRAFERLKCHSHCQACCRYGACHFPTVRDFLRHATNTHMKAGGLAEACLLQPLE
jgi:hypothetical protein